MAKRGKGKKFNRGKEVRSISRERIGTVPSSRIIEEKTRRKRPKHKKPIEGIGSLEE